MLDPLVVDLARDIDADAGGVLRLEHIFVLYRGTNGGRAIRIGWHEDAVDQRLAADLVIAVGGAVGRGRVDDDLFQLSTQFRIPDHGDCLADDHVVHAADDLAAAVQHGNVAASPPRRKFYPMRSKRPRAACTRSCLGRLRILQLES